VSGLSGEDQVITDEEKINSLFHQMTDLCLEAFKTLRKE
jgi:hypothetical protein